MLFAEKGFSFCLRKRIDEIDPLSHTHTEIWGRFHQHVYAQLLRAKRQSSYQCHFSLFRSARAKAACKMLVKLTPVFWVVLANFFSRSVVLEETIILYWNFLFYCIFPSQIPLLLKNLWCHFECCINTRIASLKLLTRKRVWKHYLPRIFNMLKGKLLNLKHTFIGTSFEHSRFSGKTSQRCREGALRAEISQCADGDRPLDETHWRLHLNEVLNVSHIWTS